MSDCELLKEVKLDSCKYIMSTYNERKMNENVSVKVPESGSRTNYEFSCSVGRHAILFYFVIYIFFFFKFSIMIMARFP